MFAFTSLGGKVLDSVNDGSGPPQFIITGQNYHRIGSLLPDPGLYLSLHSYIVFYSRYNAQTSEIDRELITELLQMIDTHNVIAQSFRRVREFYQCHPSEIFSLKLHSHRKVDRRTYNSPSCDEVAALIVGDFDSSDHGHDIIYPLLFPYGENGYQLNIPYRGQVDGYVPGRRTRVSLREFICFCLQIREQEDGIIHKCSRLFQQFVVDCFTMIESQRLYEIRMKQSTIRGEVLQGIEEAMHRGDDEASSIGTQVILPSSFTGGRRYMFNHCQDAMAICKHFGYPDLFLTITCNPNWPEFQRFTERERIPIADRPNISCRVFHAKLKCLLSVKINDVDIDNRFVVPYNPLLLMKYQAHINLEFCNKSNFIKYLFKYINKGPDRVTTTVGETYHVGESSQVVDEIKQYYDCRYLSLSESMWRIFAYDIHHRWPSVQRLTFHLSNQQHVVFDDADITTQVYLHNKDLLTMFTGWKMANMWFPDGRSLTYAEYPGKFEACSAMGFLIDDKEYVSAIKKVAEYDTVSLTREHDANVLKLNEEQRVVYDKIIDCVSNKRHGFFFVYGSIASLLLPGGKTAHFMFNIPVELTEDTICRIKKDSAKVEVVRLADLIIWDEAPMTNKLAFEALDRTLRDMMVSVSDRNKDLPFGGKVVVRW
ncbi:uncharacterized protein [Arachis hypogaea]|uniref:uncharacterized protein n=1 Tax=Arachis hypogaea TaxID=3818 RepID=UPI003B21049D